MVGGTQPQQPPPPTIPTTTPPPTSAEEEALKRNTDCVYFLASPLTCKKGADCEYRHSDIARVNPRDCWFWLNGNCLNPKCGFRHPPLDGLLGTQVPTPVGSSLPTSQTAATPVASAPYNSGKQAVPCIFFQKGFCLKGDRCPFSHAPSTVNNKVPQGPVATTLEPPTLKKCFSGLEKCSQEQKPPQVNIPKSGELLSQAKPQDKVETAPPKNAAAIDRHVTPYSALDDQPARYRPTNVPPATSGNSISRSNRVEQGHVSVEQGILNSRDADEFSREPSPGFDVLVDDDLRDSDYYHNEDHYGGTRAHEGRNLNSMNDYDSMIDVDRNMYRDPHGYDSYECIQGQYAREQRRASSERMLGGSAHLERKLYPRAESPDQIQVSDLRHHLSKQKRVNGLRSVISHDRVRDNHAVDRSYRGPSRRDVHHLPQNESSVSGRLRGRIRLPGRSSSPVNGSELHSESEMERGRNRGVRSSPERSHISTHHGKFRDRIKGRVQEDVNNDGRSLKGRVQEDINNDGRNLRGLRTRDIMNGNNPNFDGPKSLAELKGGKTAEGNEQQMNDQKSLALGKRKYPKLEHQFESESSFEGPKPLSEILKRKRAAEIPIHGSGLMAVKEDIFQKEEKESLTSSLKTTAGLSKEQANLSVHSNKEESRFPRADDARAEGRDGLIPREGTISAYGQSHLKRNLSELETEDGMTCDDTMEDHEPETFDQRDGESDYEQVDGEDYNLDEAENAEAEEYLDDDDGDDFAKKIGVMFS